MFESFVVSTFKIKKKVSKTVDEFMTCFLYILKIYVIYERAGFWLFKIGKYNGVNDVMTKM